jgi:hypothetical protein
MELVFIIILCVVSAVLIAEAIIFGLGLKAFDNLLLKFLQINQRFYTDQNNLLKNEQYLINKINESSIKVSQMSTIVSKSEAVNKDLRNMLSLLTKSISALKSIHNEELKGVSYGKETDRKPDQNNSGDNKADQ